MTEPAPLARLRLGPDHLAAMLDHLRAAFPNEGCGLLATAADSDAVVRLYRIRNIASVPRVRYEGEPLELLDAFLDMERQGWRLAAIYHSHPDSPAWPSAEDLRMARYPSSLTLIVSLRDRQHPSFGLFSLQGGRIEERRLDLEPVVRNGREV